MIQDHNQRKEQINQEIKDFNCAQLRELLGIKQQLVRGLLNDVEIFTKFIKDLNQDLKVLEAEYEIALDVIERAERNFSRASDSLYRCTMVGGSAGGECILEEQYFIEAAKELKDAKEAGEVLRKKLQRLRKERKKYRELREQANSDIRELNIDIIAIRKKMEELNCEA